RGVEEVERHRFTVLDQGVAELEAVLVDVVEKRRDPPVPRPRRVAEDGGGKGARLLVRPGGDGGEVFFGDGVVAEKEDEAAGSLFHSAVGGAGGAGVLLAEKTERIRRRRRAQDAGGPVAGPVVHDHDLEIGSAGLPAERVEHPAERVGALVGRDDDRIGRRHEKISASVVFPSGSGSGRKARKKSESKRSSPG